MEIGLTKKSKFGSEREQGFIRQSVRSSGERKNREQTDIDTYSKTYCYTTYDSMDEGKNKWVLMRSVLALILERSVTRINGPFQFSQWHEFISRLENNLLR